MREPLVEENKQDRIAFVRYLGAQEIKDGHRWKEIDSKQCYVCQGHQYCLFFWNRIISNKFLERVDLESGSFKDKKSKDPYESQVKVCIQGVGNFPMMKVQEFIIRLTRNGNRNVRHTPQETEEKRIQQFYTQYRQRDNYFQQKFQSTFRLPQYSQKQASPSYSPTPQRSPIIQSPLSGQSSNSKQNHLKLQLHASSPFNTPGNQNKFLSPDQGQKTFSSASFSLRRHTTVRNKQKSYDVLIYQNSVKKNDAQGMIEVDKYFQLSTQYDQIYAFACYLPPKKISVLFKQKDYHEQAEYTKLFLKRRKKFIPLGFKQVKKISEKREFKKNKSVFRDFQVDTFDLYRLCFEYDLKYSKLNRFIKDQNDWGVVGGHLSLSAIDRIFIAANVELIDLVENQDRSLCRYEFFEILARMAYIKFVENGPFKTVSEGLQQLLFQHILPNALDKIDGEEWRQSELWCLEVDDLFKANQLEIQKLFKLIAGKEKFAEYDAIIDMLHESELGMSVEEITLAFAFSKQTFIQEMEEIGKYKRVPYHEFLEFLARLGQIKYFEIEVPLETKITMILEILLKIVGCKLQQPQTDQNVESESDYEDDLIEKAEEQIAILRAREKSQYNQTDSDLEEKSESDSSPSSLQESLESFEDQQCRVNNLNKPIIKIIQEEEAVLSSHDSFMSSEEDKQ